MTEALEKGDTVAWVAEDYRLPDGRVVELGHGIGTGRPTKVPVIPVAVTAEMGSPWQLEAGRWVKKGNRGRGSTSTSRLANQSRTNHRFWDSVGARTDVDGPVQSEGGSLPTNSPAFFASGLAPSEQGCWVDQISGSFTRFRALTAAFILARRLRQALQDQPMVGVWLPTGVGGALTNTALRCWAGDHQPELYQFQEVAWSCLKQTPVKR